MKKSFDERYPNHRSERRNGKITQMIPAAGWWRASIFEDSDEVFYEAIAFFATCEWEEREVWDGGYTQWRKEQTVYANSGSNEEWTTEYADEYLAITCCESKLFYSPHFMKTKEEQGIDDEWIAEMKKRYKKELKEEKKNN